jgi:type I restriction enzyme S subunit
MKWGGGGKWMTIKEICTNITSGGTPLTNNRKYYDSGNIPWLRTQEVDWVDIYDTNVKITEEGLHNSSAKWIPANCVIVAMYGATAAKVGINKIPLTTNQACCNLEIDEPQASYKYVFHWFCKEYENLKILGEGTQSNINGQKVKNFKIPIPSLEEQSRIVAILDKFEALVNDMSTGLPAEIRMRRQQYEYYRNKLLTFDRYE